MTVLEMARRALAELKNNSDTEGGSPEKNRLGGEKREESEISTLAVLLDRLRTRGCPVIAEALALAVADDPSERSDAIKTARRVLAKAPPAGEINREMTCRRCAGDVQTPFAQLCELCANGGKLFCPA